MSNPLLMPFSTPFEVPPFGEIQNEHYLPAIQQSIDMARAEILGIANATEPATFENTIEALEKSGEVMGRATSILFNLNSAETSEEMQKITQEASPILTAFNNEIQQNARLFARIKAVYDVMDSLGLNAEQSMLLEKTYKGFIRSGAGLNDGDKKRFKEVAMELSTLGLKFGENVLAETNEYELVIEDENDLKGLPGDLTQRAAMLAAEKGKLGQWIFTLQAPSYIPFMEYADNRALREKMFRAYMSKALKDGDRDNKEIVKKLVTLRKELAGLLGYNTYADFVLEERMAMRPANVKDFLQDLLEKAKHKAEDEVEEIKAYMKELGVEHELQRWDWGYYSEKLRKKKYDLDDELTKPYFQLEKVIDGVFQTAEKLYGISFKENSNIPVYHEEVKAYEVTDEAGEKMAIFWADFFPRKGKRGGAWMTSFRDQENPDGKRVIPQVSIVCNFTPSSADQPSLLKFDEVLTLFHEFGHALHGMLANTRYGSLSGTSVYWDFVELPSQIFENWCYEKECLDLFAKHYETGESIPEEYIDRIRKASTYHEAYATMRQLSFGFLDMAFHDRENADIDVVDLEREALAPIDLFPKIEGTNMSVQFSHIFAGGYAAGYYSYKWAEVLDADAFALFKERGVFDKETANSFKENILSRGGTEPPMELYKRFRGQEPTVDALLERAGLS
ncbi:MAG: M3 family metallopeptidase [Cytophagales bacterium]|nr:M3 family metallopeptidase [Cytophagales bacterium]